MPEKRRPKFLQHATRSSKLSFVVSPWYCLPFVLPACLIRELCRHCISISQDRRSEHFPIASLVAALGLSHLTSSQDATNSRPNQQLPLLPQPYQRAGARSPRYVKNRYYTWASPESRAWLTKPFFCASRPQNPYDRKPRRCRSARCDRLHGQRLDYIIQLPSVAEVAHAAMREKQDTECGQADSRGDPQFDDIDARE